MSETPHPSRTSTRVAPTRLSFGDGDPVVSVITVFNRAEALEQVLLPSLRRQQGIAFEWLGVDNSAGAFDSAAAALNAGAAHAQGATLLFVHQDVVLHGERWLRHLHDWLERLPDAGIAGVIGRRAPDGAFVGFVRDRVAVTGAPFGAPAEVQTLDECVLALPRRVFMNHPFDTGHTGWHVYGVDACLRLRRAGLRAYVLPLFVRHDSAGTNRAGLAAAHTWIYRRHGALEPVIHTTCGTITSARAPMRAAARRAVVDATAELARRLGRPFPHGPNAYLQRLAERAGDVLVLHFAEVLPASMPTTVDVEALNAEAETRRRVRHRVLRPGDDAGCVLLASGDDFAPQLIVLEAPLQATDAQLIALRTAITGIHVPAIASSAVEERETMLARLSSAGWRFGKSSVRPRFGRGRHFFVRLRSG